MLLHLESVSSSSTNACTCAVAVLTSLVRGAISEHLNNELKVRFIKDLECKIELTNKLKFLYDISKIFLKDKKL